MMPYLSLLFHSLTYFISSMFAPISPSSFVLFLFSDYRQSSHAVHLLRFRRRPSESLNPLSQLKPYSGPFPFCLQAACPSFLSEGRLLFLWISLHRCFSGLHSLDRVTSCRLFLQLAFGTFSILGCGSCFVYSCLPLSSFSLKPALGFLLIFSSPPLLWLPCLAPTGYSWVRSICGQRSSQPERWAGPALSHSLCLSVRRKPEMGVLFPVSRSLWCVSRPSPVWNCRA